MNNAIRLFSILCFLVGVVTSAMTAADITSAGSGNWNATATWAGGVVPVRQTTSLFERETQ